MRTNRSFNLANTRHPHETSCCFKQWNYRKTLDSCSSYAVWLLWRCLFIECSTFIRIIRFLWLLSLKYIKNIHNTFMEVKHNRQMYLSLWNNCIFFLILIYFVIYYSMKDRSSYYTSDLWLLWIFFFENNLEQPSHKDNITLALTLTSEHVQRVQKV